jgi:hypothetical protein
MGDLISRKALLENYGLKNAVKYGNETEEQRHNSYSTLMLYEVADMIWDAPTVDVEDVVYCKDCMHLDRPRCCPLQYCGFEVTLDWYCPMGVRKDEKA